MGCKNRGKKIFAFNEPHIICYPIIFYNFNSIINQDHNKYFITYNVFVINQII